MLSLVRNNRPHTVGVLFLLALLVHLRGIVGAQLPHADEGQFVYGALLKALNWTFGDSPFPYSILNLICLSFQAIWLSAITVQYRLFKQNTYLPAFCFIVVSGLDTVMSTFNPLVLVNFLLLASLDQIFALKASTKPSVQLFNIGFFLMSAALIHFPAIFLFAFMVFALIIMRPFNPREWMILMTGMLMPMYFMLVLLFCIDHLYLMRQWPQLGISLPSQVQSPMHFLGLVFGLIVWMTSALYTMQQQLPKAPIYIRRAWISITFLLLATLFVAFFSKNDIPAVYAICLPALALMLSQSFLNQRSAKLSTISFYFALALTLFCQIF